MQWANPGAMGIYKDFRKKYEKPMQVTSRFAACKYSRLIACAATSWV